MKAEKLTDGYYLDEIEGLPYKRKATCWYYWNRAHLGWIWLEGVTDERMLVNPMQKIGEIND